MYCCFPLFCFHYKQQTNLNNINNILSINTSPQPQKLSQRTLSINMDNTLSTCSVCKSSYALEDKTPKILSCGDTFCSSCLDNIQREGIITCVDCGEQTVLSNEGVKVLPTNNGLKKLALKLASMYYCIIFIIIIIVFLFVVVFIITLFYFILFYSLISKNKKQITHTLIFLFCLFHYSLLLLSKSLLFYFIF